jgi:hypothetical protein
MTPDFTTTVNDEEVGVVITQRDHFPAWRGPAHTCPSPDDMTGYTETDWYYVDADGQEIEPLVDRVTHERIRQEVLEHEFD